MARKDVGPVAPPAPRKSPRGTAKPGGTEAPEGSSRRPSRAHTEIELMQAAMRLMERDGVLSGVNMQEVADEAGVNRGLIHHYFGSRRALLRAGISRSVDEARPEHETLRHLHPAKKRRAHFREYVTNQTFPRMIALLALDGDASFDPIPFAETRIEDFARERDEGYFDEDVDLAAMLVAWEAALLGYVLIREAASRELKISLTSLDTRVRAMLERQQEAVVSGGEAMDRPA